MLIIKTIRTLLRWLLELDQPLSIKYKLLDNAATVPTRSTAYSAAYDFYSIENVVIPSGKTMAVRTGIAIQIPNGYVGLVCSRSGKALNNQLSVGNSAGVLDPDYRGEVMAIIINHRKGIDYEVKKNEKIMQVLFLKNNEVSFDEVDVLDDTDRNEKGFGSSGR